jgi:hypothetical protein
VDAVRRRFGAGADGGLACPLPGHSGRAFIDVSPDAGGKEPRLLCCCGGWRSLGEVYAAIAYGYDGGEYAGKRSNVEIAVWTRRLACEVGLFEPRRVRLPALPDDADWATARARSGFAQLVGLRWADREPRPVAWSVRFSAAWCGLTFRQAARATVALNRGGVIVEAGREGRLSLYLPGAPQLEAVGERNARIGEEALIERLKRECGAIEVAERGEP